MRTSGFSRAAIFSSAVLLLIGISRLLVPAESPAAAQPKSQVLYRRTEFLPYEKSVEKPISYRLGRELVRQAILIAARDELGLATCDETLRETVPQNADVVGRCGTDAHGTGVPERHMEREADPARGGG